MKEFEAIWNDVFASFDLSSEIAAVEFKLWSDELIPGTVDYYRTRHYLVYGAAKDRALELLDTDAQL